MLMLVMADLRIRNEELHRGPRRARPAGGRRGAERFARDLHDLLGHSLSVIALKAELAGRLLPHQGREARRARVGDRGRRARRADRGPRGGQRLPADDARRRARRAHGWRCRPPGSRREVQRPR